MNDDPVLLCYITSLGNNELNRKTFLDWFSHINKLWWKHLALMIILMKLLQQNFAHATITQLSCLVCKILWQSVSWNLGESKRKFSSKLIFECKLISEMGNIAHDLQCLDSFTVPLHSPNGRHLPAIWGCTRGLSVATEMPWKSPQSCEPIVHCDWSNPNQY